VSLNRWVFKWRLKVKMFSHSPMSAGKRVPGGWCSNRKSAMGQFGVYARNYQQRSIGRAQSPEVRLSGCGMHLVSQNCHFIVDPCLTGSQCRE